MAVLEKKIIFGITTFREKFWECESFRTLVKAYRKGVYNELLEICVFDNTDYENWISFCPKFDDIHVHYTFNKKNPGISFSHNYIANYAKKNNFDFVVFLDQDSSLPLSSYPEYRKFAQSNTFEIAVPRVYSNEKLISPSKYLYFRSFPLKIKEDLYTLNFSNLTCINSGLGIKVEKFFSIKGYNEKLRLDFCDHEFVSRLSKVTEVLHLLDFNLNQNFSTDTNTLQQALFRYRLFVKDLQTYKAIVHNLIVPLITVDLPHLMRLTYQYKTWKFFRIRFLE